MVLIYRQLISAGYTGAASAMSSECNIDLDKWEVADNIDLFYMVQDFEEYFEMKFLKKPVLVKKSDNPTSDIRGKKGLPPKTNGGSRASASTATTSEKPKR